MMLTAIKAVGSIGFIISLMVIIKIIFDSPLAANQTLTMLAGMIGAAVFMWAAMWARREQEKEFEQDWGLLE